MRDRKKAKKSDSYRPRGGTDLPIWQPSPALADALRRYNTERPPSPPRADAKGPTPGQKDPSKAPRDPLPQVSGLKPGRLPRLDEPDEQGLTRLRPAMALPPPDEPRQEETLLYVSSKPPPPLPPVEPAAALPRARWGAGWVAACFFVLAIVVGVLATLAYRALRWHG